MIDNVICYLMSRSSLLPDARLEAIDDPPAGARVRHFDQLSEPAKEYVIVRRNGAPRPLPEDLAPGDVVVFTEYLLVTRA